MRKISATLKLSVIICIFALMISIWAVSFTDLPQALIAGKGATTQGYVNITIRAVCGDGTCTVPEEDYDSCPADCTGTCGDAVCDPTENSTVCCDECGCPAEYTCTAGNCVLIAAVPVVTPSGPPNVGGGGPPSAPAVSYSVDVDTIQVVMTPGQTIEKTFKIENDGRDPLRVTFAVEGLDNNLVLSDTEVYLEKGQSKTIKAIFYAYEAHSTDIYVGSIVITAEGIVRRITVILEVQSEEAKFDVEIYLPERFRKTYSGEIIEPQMTIFDISKTGETDVRINYELKDSDNNVILSDDEIKSVRNQLTFTKTFLLPPELKPGKYVLAVKVGHAGTVGTASQVFSIVEKRVVFSTDMLIYVAVALSLIGVLLYAIHMRKKIRRMMRRK